MNNDGMTNLPTLTIDLPLEIYHGKNNRKYTLNLNIYTRTHVRTLAKLKIGYENIVQSLLLTKHRQEIRQIQEEMKTGRTALLIYTIFEETARGVDVSNPCSVIDKFSCDGIVKAGVLPDDNWHYVREVRYRWGGVDNTNPRCRLEIYTLPAA